MDCPELDAGEDHLRLRLVRGLRRDPAGQRGREHEGLERRPRLSLALGGEVELALREARPADHREHSAVSRVDRDKAACGPSRSGSHLSIASRAASGAPGRSTCRLQAAAEDLSEPCTGISCCLTYSAKYWAGPRRPGSRTWSGLGSGARRASSNCARVISPWPNMSASTVSPAPLRRVGLATGSYAVGFAGTPARSAASGGVSSSRVLLEVHAGGHLDAVRAVPEVDGVEVRREDPVLRPAPLELPCDADSFNFRLTVRSGLM